MPEEQEIISITLPSAVVEELKERAWQLDKSVPELMSLIIVAATRDPKSMANEANLRKESREEWYVFKQELPRLLGRRKKTRQATVAEDGEWRPVGDGLITISLPVTKHRKERLKQIALKRNSSVRQEAAQMIQDALKGDFRSRTTDELEQEGRVLAQEVCGIFRDLVRHLWSGSKLS